MMGLLKTGVMLLCVLACLAILGFPLERNAISKDTKPAVDGSLTPEGYEQFGVPDPRKKWTAEDLASAVKVLDELVRNNPARLPRRDSAKSGEVFKRLVSEEYLASLADEQLPTRQRMEALATMGPVAVVFLMYVKAATESDDPLDVERVESGIAFLRMQRAMFGLFAKIQMGDEAATTQGAKARESANRLQKNCAQLIEKMFDMLGDARNMRNSEKIRLAKALTELLPDVWPHYLKKDRDYLELKLDNATRGADQELKLLMEKLSETLGKTVAI